MTEQLFQPPQSNIACDLGFVFETGTKTFTVEKYANVTLEVNIFKNFDSCRSSAIVGKSFCNALSEIRALQRFAHVVRSRFTNHTCCRKRLGVAAHKNGEKKKNEAKHMLPKNKHRRTKLHVQYDIEKLRSAYSS